MIPADAQTPDLAQWRDCLESLLLETEPLWRPSVFHERRPPWCAEYPDLTQRLLALDDADLNRLSADSAISAEWLEEAIPALREIRALTAMPEPLSVPANETPPGVSVRKAGQIDAFVSAVGRPCAPVVDWCAGKGHLSRRFVRDWNCAALAIERNPELCAAGDEINRAAGQISQRFLTADVLDPATSASLCDSHAIALHACGDLHRTLLQAAAARVPAIDLAPCCYQLIAEDTWQPLSKNTSLTLTKNALKLAVTDCLNPSPRKRALSEQASAWKLAFVHLREETGAAGGPFPSVPAAWQHLKFPDFLTRLAAREEIELPAGFDFTACERAGWTRHRESRRLQLLRLSFRRAIELWILSDLGVWLEQQGYAVTLRQFCDRRLTPRNLLLSARRL